ncbi:MAG: hypothetical protein NTZ78_00695 [Candidatus Aureabacteria bacterium]|nr:hypothetical protein [Candidatus Auribacterota bacterium]
MKRNACLALLLCSMLPKIGFAGVWGMGLGTGRADTFCVVKDFGFKIIDAYVVPWGLTISIEGGGNTLGTEWLWLALQKWPSEKLMFIMPDGRLSKKPVPFGAITGGFLEEFSFETPGLEITPDIPEGLYIVTEIMTYSPNNVFDKSNWSETYPSSTYIFTRRELNRQEWESQGWAIYEP